jgi:hypothetical protein
MPDAQIAAEGILSNEFDQMANFASIAANFNFLVTQHGNTG